MSATDFSSILPSAFKIESFTNRWVSTSSSVLFLKITLAFMSLNKSPILLFIIAPSRTITAPFDFSFLKFVLIFVWMAKYPFPFIYARSFLICRVSIKAFVKTIKSLK